MCDDDLPYDPVALRRLREERGWKREALVAHARDESDLAFFSLPSLVRAERGEASVEMVKKIVRALKVDFRAVVPEGKRGDEAESGVEIAGRWEAFYIEDDVATEPYVYSDFLSVRQNGAEITGIYEPNESGHPEAWQRPVSFTFNGQIIEDCLLGIYKVDGNVSAQASGVLQICFIDQATRGHGFCTWYDDQGFLATSAHYWIRLDHDDYRTMRAQIKKKLLAEMKFLRSQ